MANDLVAGAAHLHEDGQQTVVEHAPQASPGGCKGAFTLTLQPGDGFPNPPGSGGLLIGCEDDPGLAANGYSHSTTSHLHAVRVKETFTVSKRAGETVRFTLLRHGDRVDVVGVQ